MELEVIPPIGGQPLRLNVAQFILRNEAGTPVLVAGRFGPQGAIKVSVVSDPDFNSVLRAFGYHQHQVEAVELDLRAPAGERI